LSGKEELLLIPPPLRTERASFPAFGSSLSKPSSESQRHYSYYVIVYDSLDVIVSG